MTGEEALGSVVPKRSHLNNMNPCMWFPRHDLEALFAEATLPEAMLVALDHMQASVLRC